MKLFLEIAMLLFLGSDVLVDPAYPPNVISGGTVVAELKVISGKIKEITVLSGEEPFIGSSKTALAQWHLQNEGDGKDLVIVHFRQPNFYYGSDSGEAISFARRDKHLPYPERIVGPSYPAHNLVQGSAVLRTEISVEGGVKDIQVVRSLGTLTDVSIEAVRKWKFIPAENDRGVTVPSYIYVVFVYRFPVTEQKK